MEEKEKDVPEGRLYAQKKNLIILSCVILAFGIVLLIWPQATLEIACKVIGVMVLIAAIVILISGFTSDAVPKGAAIAAGAVAAIVGIWMITSPEILITIFPTIVGVFILLDGVFSMVETMSIGTAGGKLGWNLLLSILTILGGLLLIFKPLGIAKFIVRVLGVVLIYTAVSDILIASRIRSKVVNVPDSEIEDTADAENVEEEDQNEKK